MNKNYIKINKTAIFRYFQIFVKCTWYLSFTWYWLGNLYPLQRTTKRWFWGEGCFLRLILGVHSIRSFEKIFAIPIMNPLSWFMILIAEYNNEHHKTTKLSCRHFSYTQNHSSVSLQSHSRHPVDSHVFSESTSCKIGTVHAKKPESKKLQRGG